MARSKLPFDAFIAPFHPVDENLTLAVARDLELAQCMDKLGYNEASASIIDWATQDGERRDLTPAGGSTPMRELDSYAGKTASGAGGP